MKLLPNVTISGLHLSDLFFEFATNSANENNQTLEQSAQEFIDKLGLENQIEAKALVSNYIHRM